MWCISKWYSIMALDILESDMLLVKYLKSKLVADIYSGVRVSYNFMDNHVWIIHMKAIIANREDQVPSENSNTTHDTAIIPSP